MELSVGIKVAARGLEWDVMEVERLGLQQRLRLACSTGDLRGLEWDVLHPAEAVTVLQAGPRLEEAGPLAAWRRFHTACLLDQLPGAPVPAGRIAIEPYQLVPLLRAREMVRVRLLLADGVGLGKTIQAGLIAADLIVRRRAHRVLVVAPPGPLLRQWEQEMRIRFGLRFSTVAEAADLHRIRRGLELGENPFDTMSLCLTSIDFAKQDRVLDELERTNWDLVIIDEAHHCVAGSGEPSQRRRLAEALARQADGLLLLTATPHDGHDQHFASLIGLLDPALVDQQGGLIGDAYRRHVVRRLKSHIRNPETGAPLFRNRIMIPVRIELQAARLFHQVLSDFVAPRLRRGTRQGGMDDALAFVSLLKRSMSSIAACVATLQVVAARYAKPAGAKRDRQRLLRAWRRRQDRFGVLTEAQEAELADLEAEAVAASLSGSETEHALRDLIRLGHASAQEDPKLAALLLEIRLIRLTYPNANILVYTEYTETQRAAVVALAGIDGTVLTISGGDPEEQRTAAAERCANEDGIVLISTDSMAEGLNLHQRCRHLIHLDLPYNPNRLEQRNGRIDRYGQRFDPEIRYLYLAGTFEERLLLRLITKYEAARTCLSFMPNTLGVGAEPGRLGERLVAGFAEERRTLFSDTPRLVHSLDAAAEEEAGESYRDLLREIDRAFQGFDRMAVQHGWMNQQPVMDPAAEQPSDIDLVGFVTTALEPEGDGYRVPKAWRRELEGLAGYDGERGLVRLTCRRDELDRTLMFPGRCHPLTRRTIADVRGRRAGRVSAARADGLSLLVTYQVSCGVGCRRVFGLRLFPDGSVRVIEDVLSLAVGPDLPAKIWRPHFGSWVETVLAGIDAEEYGREQCRPYLEQLKQARVRRRSVAQAWLDRRASDLCGPSSPVIADLFGAAQTETDWRLDLPSERRLQAFVADLSQPLEKRREAEASLGQFADPVDPPVVSVQILGMLMLCP